MGGTSYDAECVLILGGSRARELAAARSAASSARAIILSSGALTQDELCSTVRDAGGHAQCRIDRVALDTVTNFTSMIAAFVAANVTTVTVATDADHRRRALAIGRIVLGSRGIRVRPLIVNPTPCSPASGESTFRVIRDVLRAVLWALTGMDGTSIAQLVHPRRAADVREWRTNHEGAGDCGRDEAIAAWLAAAMDLCGRNQIPSDEG